jgi:hypothetical protein
MQRWGLFQRLGNVCRHLSLKRGSYPGQASRNAVRFSSYFPQAYLLIDEGCPDKITANKQVLNNAQK